MIKLLEGYISKTILYASGLTTCVFVGVLFLLSLISELKNIGEGDYGFSQAMLYVLMHMPGTMYQFAPMLILVGSIVGLSMLMTYRELAVMRISGCSIQKIIYSVLLAGFALTLIMSLMGEGLAPQMNYLSEINKENSRNAGLAVMTSAGIWLHEGNNFIHVGHVINRHRLEDVTRYQIDQYHHLLAIYHVKILTDDNQKWTMHDGVKTIFGPNRTQSQTFRQDAWDLQLNPNVLNTDTIDAKEMSLSKLVHFAHYLERNGLQAKEYQYEFWQRVFQPLATLIMVFLAIPSVLGSLKSSTLSFRIVLGIIAGTIFFIMNAFLGQICIIYQVPPALAALLPLLFFTLLGMVLMKHTVT